MFHFPYPSYLRTHRKRWALYQDELGKLLGLPKGVISKYERLERAPSVEALIGSEFVFGESGRRIFPHLYAAVEIGVTKRAAEQAERISTLKDKRMRLHREFLEEIARRAASDQATI